jgi:hypothetical protein
VALPFVVLAGHAGDLIAGEACYQSGSDVVGEVIAGLTPNSRTKGYQFSVSVRQAAVGQEYCREEHEPLKQQRMVCQRRRCIKWRAVEMRRLSQQFMLLSG